jgi:hypothetical protein
MLGGVQTPDQAQLAPQDQPFFQQIQLANSYKLVVPLVVPLAVPPQDITVNLFFRRI